MMMWGGDFDHEIGGYIFSVKLTHIDVAPKVFNAKPTPTPARPSGPSPVEMPPAVKPTEAPSPAPRATSTPKPAAVSPKCPSGYKKKS